MLAPETRLGRYVIEAPLGEGGMGVVYRAYDSTLRRRVALKVIRPDGPSLPADRAARMLREARAAAALDHPNVVTIFDVGEHEGTPFIAMELLKGTPLRALLGSLDVTLEKKLAWLLQIASALAAAHDAGLVHRDVKPDNVMVLENGAIKVLDFGIARIDSTDPAPITALERGPSSFRTAPDKILGTPRYMAPEQLTGGDLDGRVDQFAWGLVAYELLAGREAREVEPEFSEVTSWSKPARPVAEVAPGVRTTVSDVVMRALERDRARRWESMDALVVALTAAAPELTVARERTMPPPATAVAIAATLTEEAVASTKTMTTGPRGRTERPPVDAATSGARRARAWLGALGVVAAAVAAWRMNATRPPAPAVRSLDDRAKLVEIDRLFASFGLAATRDGALLAGTVDTKGDLEEASFPAFAWLQVGGGTMRVKEKLRGMETTIAYPVVAGAEPYVMTVANNENASAVMVIYAPPAPGTTDAGLMGGARSTQRTRHGARWIAAAPAGALAFAAVDAIESPPKGAQGEGRETVRSFVFTPNRGISMGLLAENAALVGIASAEGRGAVLVNRDHTLEVAFFDITAQPLGAPVVLGDSDASAGAIAFAGAKLVAVWKDARAPQTGRWKLATVEGPTASPTVEVAGTEGAECPSLVADGGKLHALWVRRGVLGTELMFASATDPLQLPRAAVTLRAAPGMFDPVLGVAGASRWAAWHEGNDHKIFAARLPAD